MLAFVLFFLTFHVILAKITSALDIGAYVEPARFVDRPVIALAGAVALVACVVLTFHPQAWGLTGWMGWFLVAAVVSGGASRFFFANALAWMRARGRVAQPTCLLGPSECNRRFLSRLQPHALRFFDICGVIDADEFFAAERDIDAVVEAEKRLIDQVRRSHAIDLVITADITDPKRIEQLIAIGRDLPMNVYVNAEIGDYRLLPRALSGRKAQKVIYEVARRPISGVEAVLKVVEDRVLAAILIVVLSPLLAFTALAIKIDSAGPVIFKQKRYGYNGRVFNVYKFRSMRHRAAPEARVVQATKGDPRVTRVGRFIRATSLDELPQLFNVLEGTMSLVGPRPHPVSIDDEFSDKIRRYFSRFRVRPGITGWAQVNGYRGETDTVDKMRARIEHDIYYADNWSLLFDIRILVMTVLTVLFHKNAY